MIPAHEHCSANGAGVAELNLPGTRKVPPQQRVCARQPNWRLRGLSHPRCADERIFARIFASGNASIALMGNEPAAVTPLVAPVPIT